MDIFTFAFVFVFSYFSSAEQSRLRKALATVAPVAALAYLVYLQGKALEPRETVEQRATVELQAKVAYARRSLAKARD